MKDELDYLQLIGAASADTHFLLNARGGAARCADLHTAFQSRDSHVVSMIT